MKRGGSQSTSSRLSLKFIAADVISEVFCRLVFSHVADRKIFLKRKAHYERQHLRGLSFVFGGF